MFKHCLKVEKVQPCTKEANHKAGENESDKKCKILKWGNFHKLHIQR